MGGGGRSHAGLVTREFHTSTVKYRDLVTGHGPLAIPYQAYDAKYESDYLSVLLSTNLTHSPGRQSTTLLCPGREARFRRLHDFTLDYEFLSGKQEMRLPVVRGPLQQRASGPVVTLVSLIECARIKRRRDAACCWIRCKPYNRFSNIIAQGGFAHHRIRERDATVSGSVRLPVGFLASSDGSFKKIP